MRLIFERLITNLARIRSLTAMGSFMPGQMGWSVETFGTNSTNVPFFTVSFWLFFGCFLRCSRLRLFGWHRLCFCLFPHLVFPIFGSYMSFLSRKTVKGFSFRSRNEHAFLSDQLATILSLSPFARHPKKKEYSEVYILEY